MKPVRKFPYPSCRDAFSLVEMAVVIAILLVVMTAGVGLRTGAPAASRRAAVDLVMATIDCARTKAMARRVSVVAALAAPSELPAGGDGRCRIGLFQVVSEKGESPETVHEVMPLGRWKTLDLGISWTGGKVDGTINPCDQPRLVLRNAGETLRLHGIIFDARGGLQSPAGSAPALIRIGQAGHRAVDGEAPETLLRVGRVTGRIYQSDQ